MLTLLIMLYLRKLNSRYSITNKIKYWNFWRLKLPVLILLFCLPSLNVYPQKRNLKFGVWKSKICIGFIYIRQETNNQQTTYKVQSQINYKILFPIEITSLEKSVFNNGVLTYSSINRKINDREKVNKLLEYSYGVYRLTDGVRFKIVSLDTLRHNLVKLYFIQPSLIKRVYCDNHQAVSDVIKLAEGKFKVAMPDGSYNIFHYQNGKCIKVEVNNPLYKVELHPIKI